MTSKRFISNIIYRLKRRYGTSVNIIELLDSSLNVETGEKTNTFDSVRVDRAVILPSRINREFVYDLSYIADNKEFTMGGMFDTTKRRILFDIKDIQGIDLKNKYLVSGQVRYDVLEVHEFDYATIVVCKQVTDHPLNNVIEVNAYSDLRILSQEATNA